MRQFIFAVLGLLLVGASSLVTPAPHNYNNVGASNPHPSLWSWRKLSDLIVQTIWGLPEDQRSTRVHHGAVGGAARGAPDGTLVARYGDDVVLRFNVTTAEETSALAEATNTLFLDVWEFNEDWVDIRISKDVVPSLLGLLPKSLQNAHVPLMQDLDLAQAIFDSYPSPSSTQTHDGHDSFSASPKSSGQPGRGHPFFQDYQPLSVIQPWMDLMASMFSTHVRKINIGISYEGRDIPALRVGVHPTNDEKMLAPRKTILITGGSHAREWISTSTVNYIAWSLINSYGKDHAVTKLLEAFDFVLIPTLNPDGYVYSWESDRLWRKNRQPTSLRFCQGIDLDRSYSFQWDGGSTRSNPCSESFAGDAPFDGVEASRFADWAKNETVNNNVEFFALLDLHSYSQQILYPYSFSCDESPPTVEDLEELALGLAKAIRISRKGRPYKVTSACEGNVAMSKDGKKIFPRIESTGGSALDWFYHEMKLKYAYQVKLRDRGTYGFLLPRENIIPTGEELVGAVHYLGHFLLGEIGFAMEKPEFVHREDVEEESVLGDDNEDEDYEENDDSQFELRRRR